MSKKKSFFVLLLLVLNFVFIIVSGILYDLLSLVAINFVALVAGVSFSLKVKNSKQRIDMLLIFALFFLLYSVYTVFTDSLYVNNQLLDFFYSFDTITFVQNSQTYLQSGSLQENLEEILFDYSSLEWIGFAYFNYLVGYLFSFFGPIDQIVLKVPVVFFSSMILLYVYRILTKVTPSGNNLLYVIVYGFLSYSLFYSGVLLRDVHIGFLFVILINKFFTAPKLSKIPSFVVIILIIATFRPEYGIFSSIFLLVYIFYYLRQQSSKQLVIFVVPLLLLGLILTYIKFTSDIQETFLMVSDTTARYEELTLTKSSTSSLGAKLLNLPWGIRHLAGGAFSQIYPFPFYSFIISDGWSFLPFGIGAVYWFVIWFILLKTFFYFGYSSEYKFQLLLLFTIAIVLILGASASADTRRVMCVYPIIYVVVISLIEKRSKRYISISSIQAVFTYMFLLSIYLLVK